MTQPTPWGTVRGSGVCTPDQEGSRVLHLAVPVPGVPRPVGFSIVGVHFHPVVGQSTVDAYERHLRALSQRHLQQPSSSPIQVLREYLLSLYRHQQTSSDIRQAISACRMLEEVEIAAQFIPRSIWRIVRAKDKVQHLAARGWGSLSALWAMAEAAQTDEEMLVTAIAVLAIAYCNRIGESASIRVQDIDQAGGTVSFFDRKTRNRWITRPASTYARRLLGFIRATALRLGRRPGQPLVKGGARAIQQVMVRLLQDTEYSHLRWHAWRRLGATMFIRNGATMPELLSWGRWRSLEVARRYVARWDDCPWEDSNLPRPTLLPGPGGCWRFEKGSRTSRSLWPSSVLSRSDVWESDGSDDPNPGHFGAPVPEILPEPEAPAKVKRPPPPPPVPTATGPSSSAAAGPHTSSGESRPQTSTPKQPGKRPKVVLSSPSRPGRGVQASLEDRIKRLASKAKQTAKGGGLIGVQ